MALLTLSQYNAKKIVQNILLLTFFFLDCSCSQFYNNTKKHDGSRRQIDSATM